VLISKHFLRILSVVALPLAAQAFMTPPGRIVRYQPWKLAQEKAFRVDGTLRFGGLSVPYQLNWLSPGNYEVILKSLPSTLYSNGSLASEEWKIVRKGGGCVLKTSKQIASCAGPGIWGIIELGGRAEAAVEALLQAEILSPEIAADAEINSSDPASIKPPSQQKLTVGKNHGMSTAFIEIRGKNVMTDASENRYPVIQYDQTFLAPRLLRVKTSDDIYTVESNSELDIEKNQPRQSFVLAERLVIRNRKDQEVVVLRKEPGPLPVKYQTGFEKTLYDVSVVSDGLTFDGQYLLSALLFSH